MDCKKSGDKNSYNSTLNEFESRIQVINDIDDSHKYAVYSTLLRYVYIHGVVIVKRVDYFILTYLHFTLHT